jgi:23S rRNA (adenine2503-C2)-methyltransferase
MSLRPFSDLTPTEVQAWVTQRGFPSYRAHQLLRWFYRSPAASFAAMTNLPETLREALVEEFLFSILTRAGVTSADAAQTRKYLFELGDGELLEAVCMRYARTPLSAGRTTLCLSTQVGCAVGCPFCATGQLGLKRNMTASEVIDQVLSVAREERARGGRVTHLVYMGMGEPLHNVDATLGSVQRFCDPEAVGIGARRVTVSTSGVVPAIDRLAEHGGGVNLAVSLHAVVDEVRDQLVPLNRRWPVAELLAAADRYARRTGRRVSFEYVMLGGVNDSDGLATELGRRLRGRLAHVNLIPYNPIPGDPYQPSSRARIGRFAELVRAAGIECTVRDTRGRRIDAACGQLRAEAERARAAVTKLTTESVIVG